MDVRAVGDCAVRGLGEMLARAALRAVADGELAVTRADGGTVIATRAEVEGADNAEHVAPNEHSWIEPAAPHATGGLTETCLQAHPG